MAETMVAPLDEYCFNINQYFKNTLVPTMEYPRTMTFEGDRCVGLCLSFVFFENILLRNSVSKIFFVLYKFFCYCINNTLYVNLCIFFNQGCEVVKKPAPTKKFEFIGFFPTDKTNIGSSFLT